MDAQLREHVPRKRCQRDLVDASTGLVRDLDRHGALAAQWPVRRRPPDRLAVRASRVVDGREDDAAFSASQRAYASTMSPTRRCRTTSLDVRWQKCTSSMPSRISCTTLSPE